MTAVNTHSGYELAIHNTSTVRKYLLWRSKILQKLATLRIIPLPSPSSRLPREMLLKGEPPPECIPCNCLLIIKHLLIECANFNDLPIPVSMAIQVARNLWPYNVHNDLHNITSFILSDKTHQCWQPQPEPR